MNVFNDKLRTEHTVTLLVILTFKNPFKTQKKSGIILVL